MRHILTGSILGLVSLSLPAIAQDTSPMQPAAVPGVDILAPEEAPLPEFRDLHAEAAERCVADFQLPYICCADDAAMGAMTDEDRRILRLAREGFCTSDDGEYPIAVAPPGGIVNGPGAAPDSVPDRPVEPVETESDAFGSSERPH